MPDVKVNCVTGRWWSAKNQAGTTTAAVCPVCLHRRARRLGRTDLPKEVEGVAVTWQEGAEEGQECFGGCGIVNDS